MTVQPGDPAQDVVGLAAEHQAARTALEAATLAAVLAAWESGIDPFDLVGSWWRLGLGVRIFTLLSMAQETAASESNDFVERSYNLLNEPIRRPQVVPNAFAGIASDGRDLETLLAVAPIRSLQRVRRGEPPEQAVQSGRQFLEMVVPTQIADAGRAADQVAIATAEPVRRTGRKNRYGWVRMLNPPSCARCVVLAGRFYKWNEGFKRHEMCDCAHIPAIEAVENDLTTDPKAYFDSLTRQEQNETFGKANAEAIRNGADVSQVINATTRGGVRTADDGRRYTLIGTTRRGLFGGSTGRGGVLRPTPWQIYRDARGDPDEARRLLVQYRYILR